MPPKSKTKSKSKTGGSTPPAAITSTPHSTVSNASSTTKTTSSTMTSSSSHLNATATPLTHTDSKGNTTPLSSSPLPPIDYVGYESEHQLQGMMSLIENDLSEPYSIYTY
ncbi:hypothetical protein FBU30_000623, partial [Linnemannia zychae]